MGDGLRQLLTARQLAERLQLSERTVRDHARRGLLPTVRVGGSWRFDPEAVAAHLRRLSQPAVVPVKVQRNERERARRLAEVQRREPNPWFTSEELAGTAPDSIHLHRAEPRGVGDAASARNAEARR